MIKNTLRLFVLLMLCLTGSVRAKAINALDNLFNLNFLENQELALLRAPDHLSKYGVTFYALTVISKQQIRVELFDSLQFPLGAVVLNKYDGNGSALYEISQANGVAAWVRLDVLNKDSLITCVAKASTGASLRIRVDVAPVMKRAVVNILLTGKPFKSISVFRNMSWEKLLPPTKPLLGKQQRDIKEPLLLQKEEEAFYKTPQLKLLREVVLNIDAMTKQHLEKGDNPFFAKAKGSLISVAMPAPSCTV